MPAVLEQEHQQQRRVLDATKRYVAGEISIDQLEKTERENMPGPMDTLFGLTKARRRHRHGWRGVVVKLIGL